MTESKTVHVIKATSLATSGGQTDGMIRQNAITSLSEKVCASVMIAKPHTCSAIHHHGDQDTIVYAAKGHGTIISDEGKTRQDLAPGDFALIPAYAKHQEANDADEEVSMFAKPPCLMLTSTGRLDHHSKRQRTHCTESTGLGLKVTRSSAPRVVAVKVQFSQTASERYRLKELIAWAISKF